MILAIENTPTYKRTRQQLEEIRKQAQGKTPEDDAEGGGGEPVQGVISFV